MHGVVFRHLQGSINFTVLNLLRSITLLITLPSPTVALALFFSLATPPLGWFSW